MMAIQLLVLAATFFVILLALEVKDWGCAIFGGLALGVQIVVLGGM